MNHSPMIRAELALTWTEKDAAHRDRTFVRTINFWRDLFPEGISDALSRANEKETVQKAFTPGKLVPPYDQAAFCKVQESAFSRTTVKSGVTPRVGRFYPRGVLSSTVGCFPQDIRPFRVTGRENDLFTVDLNHPLSRLPLVLEATVLQRRMSPDERGGNINVISEMATENGPGMQAGLNGMTTDFSETYPFKRQSETDDAEFYQKPRFVYHMDQKAVSHVRDIYGKLLKPGFKVLDLMSSWVSHLPEDLADLDVTGLGMNAEELKANPALARFVIHDLNAKPELPFNEQEFDAVICTSSVEYLIRPIEVFSDIARILKPGGVFVNTFSDRWFSPKVITLWEELHPFERMGLILECMRKTGRFFDLHTESIRGDIRPRMINTPASRQTPIRSLPYGENANSPMVLKHPCCNSTGYAGGLSKR